MSPKRKPTEGGSGGKRGHSNMEHWTHTQEVKDTANRRRRQADKEAEQDETQNESDTS